MTTEPRSRIRLGSLYRDSVTGFEGIATSRHIYIAGCDRFTLQKRKTTAEGELVTATFDGPMLEYIKTPKKMAALLTKQRLRVAADPAAAG